MQAGHHGLLAVRGKARGGQGARTGNLEKRGGDGHLDFTNRDLRLLERRC